MICDETNEERQNNEFAVIQSMYDNAVVDNRDKIAWNVWRPLNLLLTLKPNQNSDTKEIHCSVTLHIKCCQNYPDKPPKLSIHKKQGLSIENETRLLNELKAQANELCGEVMIFQLAQHAQHFLNEHNKPTLSFYEEMLLMKNKKEKLELDDLKAKEEEERRKIVDEIQRRKEMFKEAGRQSTRKSSTSQDQDNVDGVADSQELIYYADIKVPSIRKIVHCKTEELPCTCNNKGMQTFKISQRNNKKIYIGNCLGHSSYGATTYMAIEDDTGEVFITKKWFLPPITDLQTREQQLAALQRDLKNMRRLKHTTLVPYIAMEMCKEISKRTSKQCVYVFRNFVLGTSLSAFKVKMNIFSDKFEQLKLLRHVATGVLSALDELHSADVLHRDIRSENIFLDNNGAVKLVGASLDSRLIEILESDNYYSGQTSAQDIYDMGELLVSIVSPDGNYSNIPQELPLIAKDFISRCKTEDEHSKWSVKQLLNHSFLVESLTKQPSNKGKDDNGSGSEDDDTVKKIQPSSLSTNGHSRLNDEFVVLEWLGKGAFGDVLKVKNKLDGGFYAIKSIKLNPKSVVLNKKITREVTLLSRLNHENVVRYYNAWIESTLVSYDNDDDRSSLVTLTRTPTSRKPGDNLECIVTKLGQGVKADWSLPEVSAKKVNCSSDNEDEEDDDNDDDDDDDDDDDNEAYPWTIVGAMKDMIGESSSSSIMFEKNTNEESDERQTQKNPSEDTEDSRLKEESPQITEVLYIQMEFCEKHTLRQAIDSGLYIDQFRAWRLFREIVEGLAHVHQKGMIHRDLKPANIFLDHSDHVKIGDFGLATKAFTTLALDDKMKSEEVGGSLTGQIGTALYVAPELLQSERKVIYNQKVDIYSLGIILFEMFHPPFETGMEKMKILADIRTKDIVMPKSFDVEEHAKQIHAIKWLLNHEASLRPTCTEILGSEHVPRRVPEGKLSGLLSHTLSDRTARGYQRLVAGCLDQHLSPAEDYTYHNGMRTKPVDILAAIKDSVVKIFRSHGANEFAPPLFTPRAKSWDQRPNAVKVMTASGYVCHLPHDLRLPFARHTAYSGVKYIRRYVVDRVYRERHVQGFHPKEIIECAFDIVTPRTESLWSDAELLVVAYRAATECSLNVSIQLNHIELIRSLLQTCGVPIDKHIDIYPVLVDFHFGRINGLQLQTHLTSLCITNRDVSNLLRLMEADVSVHEVRDLVAPLMKQSKWNSTVSRAVLHLETVCNNAKALGCECQITVAPFLAYNATQHSGIFWQMSVVRNVEHKLKAKHRSNDLIAAGGRYDALVEEFWKVARTEKDNEHSALKSCSVGFSMSLERIAAILKKMETTPSAVGKDIESPVIYVCVSGAVGTDKEGVAAEKRARLARELWAGGYSACAWPAHPREALDLHGAGFTALQDDAIVRLSSWGADRVIREQKIPYTEAVEIIKQKISTETTRCPEGSSTNRSTSWTEVEKYNCPTTAVTFITASDKMTKSTKRYCENQINTQITSILTGLGLQSSRVRVQVVALDCDANCVRSLAAHLAAPLHHDDLAHAFRTVSQTYPKHHRILDEALMELSNILKLSYQNRTNEETQLYALYSIPDSLCRLIT